MPKKTPQQLLKDLDSSDNEVRRRAAYNRNATPEVLLTALEDENKYVRQNAAENRNIKKLDITIEKWLQYIANGCFDGFTKNIPSHVKKDPRYKSSRLIAKLTQTDSE